MGDSSDDDNDDDDDDDTDDECLFKFGENSGYNSGKARAKQSDREIEKISSYRKITLCPQ